MLHTTSYKLLPINYPLPPTPRPRPGRTSPPSSRDTSEEGRLAATRYLLQTTPYLLQATRYLLPLLLPVICYLLPANLTAQCTNPVNINIGFVQVQIDQPYVVGQTYNYCIESVIDLGVLGMIGTDGTISFVPGTVNPPFTLSLTDNTTLTTQTVKPGMPGAVVANEVYDFEVVATAEGTATLSYVATNLGLAFNLTIVVTMPVPVELLSFTGSAVGRSNRLDWSTAVEENVRYFEVQKSENSAFSPTDIDVLAPVAAAGNSLRRRDYVQYDERPGPVTYYRLRSVDYDGSEQFSDLIRVERAAAAGEGIKIYPNPTHGTISVDLPPGNHPYTVEVLDFTGAVIVKNSEPNGRRFDLDLALPAGVYLLRCRTEGRQWTERLLVR